MESPQRVTLYRWQAGVRVELTVVADGAGRVEAVSLWHNRRQEIHHQPGVRAEAERLIADGAA